MKRQLLFIHGGESFNSREEYLDFLNSFEPQDAFTNEESRKWKYKLPAQLGNEWVCGFPRMPNAITDDYSIGAHYHEWKMWFEKHIASFNDNLVLVGHSLGANFLAKYLSEETLPVRVGQLHLVAGCYGEGSFTLSENLDGVSTQCDNVFIYHSTDDDSVLYADALRFKEALPTAELVTFEDRGHFLQEEFPELIERILK